MVLLAGLAACGSEPARERRNVLLITLDTTRFNAVGFMGNPAKPTPRLDEFAKESVVYEMARTVTPLTMPAHASMLTGLYPPRHTITANGARPLPKSAHTLAEYARAEGVQTAAFVASLVLDRSFGLSQGFDTYEGVEAPKDRAAPKIEELRAPQVLARANAWLAARDHERPFLLWAHLFDAHDPYDPPQEFSAAHKSAYLGEIAFMDRALGEFLDTLRTDGTLADTLVVIVGDHGEGLRQHQEATHGWFCYESTIRVPMLVRFPDGWRRGERSIEVASVVDVFPTALSALGIVVPRDLDGTNLDHALVPADRGVYFECFNGAENFGWSPLVGWADARTKYIHSSVPELYDVLPDAREIHNLAAGRPEVAARMLDQIRRVRSSPPLAHDGDEQVDLDAQRALRGLGYVESGPGGLRLDPLEPGDRPGPVERKPELALFESAGAASSEGRIEAAVALWAELVGRYPENLTARSLWASDLIRLQRAEEALPLFEHIGAHRGLTANECNNLGWCREQAGDRFGAREAYARALELDPQHPWATGNLERVQQN